MLAVAACNNSDVIERLDAVRGTGRRFAHDGLRSPGEQGTTVRSISAALRQDPQARAILESGAKAVPDLARLLEDPERGQLAAAVLAEIGGNEAADALLHRWRELRDATRQVRLYRVLGGERYGIGYRYEGSDHETYAELIVALGYAGGPVSAEIAKDTETAITEAGRLAASGELVLRENRVDGGREIEARWDAPPVDTACEGLRILAMASAPEAPYVCDLALRSSVPALRSTAARVTLYLGKDAVQMLPALARLLDEEDLRRDALEPLALLLDGSLPDPNLTAEQQGALVTRYKTRLRESGQLSR